MNVIVIMRKYFNFSSHVSRRVTCQKSMETFQKESCVRGYHIYRELWDAVVGEELECQRERGNATDMYAVAVIKDCTIVGHLPRKISRICSLLC